ncbi:sensor histidine kinase [Streptomyces sp. Ru73]|uniref:sensor histidine kinase n=1 Tax=Streptomyces sp. Ru73 TaxID=2080748 RepID=UPI000CDDE62D|nr:histidine kinase [Streptomyces sp. Ru73]POX37626.1 sensor histidine kinase [Streptomyces sp. Ru73]
MSLGAPKDGPVTFRKGPTPTTFLPWLIMGVGAISNTLNGKAGNPWLAGAGLLAFNSLYVGVVRTAFDPRARATWVPYGLLAALAVVTYALGIGYGGAWMLFFPLMTLAAGTLLRGRPLFVALFIASASAGTLAGHGSGDPWDASTIGYGTFISGMVTSAVLGLFETNRRLRATEGRLARTAVEKERLRFSRDLHDLLGHTLSVVVVKAEAVRRLAPRDVDAALEQAADIEAVGRQALTEIREAVTGYRQGSLATELDRARSALEAGGIEPVVRQSGPPLSPQAGALLGWVVREGVTNAVRHSGATRCEIEVRVDSDRARLTITDDGRGPVSSQAPAEGGGTGLTGLAERLAAAGGTLDAGPDGRRGFRLVAELPEDTGVLPEAEEMSR